jgi:ribosomal protein S18 acetylase RimI-like enzyme
MTTADGPTDAELARLELENELELWTRSVALAPRGDSGRDGSVAWFASGLPVASFNQVLTVGTTIDPASLDRAVATLRSRTDPFEVRIRAGIDDALIPQLERLGLREDPDEGIPGMAAHPIDDIADDRHAGADPPGLEIRKVDDDRGHEDHQTVVAEGFGMPIALVRALLPLAGRTIPGIALFVGYADGRAAATALGFTAGSTVGVYNVATLADARRLGYGGAMTRRVIADGRARGATVAILQSSAMGRRLYESIGFREVVAYRAFIEVRRADRPAP